MLAVMAIGQASRVAPAWKPETKRVGEWEITALSDGHLRLDGGAMWGVVPATLWRQWTPPEADNTILMALRPFLFRRAGHVVLVEPGIGKRWSDKWRRIYGIEHDADVVSSLAAVGLRPEDVTTVVGTHAHFDHVGAMVTEDQGQPRPVFPNARHVLPAIEIEMALADENPRSGSYRAEDVQPLLDAGMLQGVEGIVELAPDLRLHVLGGHSDGVSVVTVHEDGPDAAVFWSDVVPTMHHIQPPYIMAYDIDVIRSFEVRSAWLNRAAEGNWLGCFFHDLDHAFGRVKKTGRRFEAFPE
jgi:glyoxylase-like metal-dependent hydrolase (beta-lactamase superfamily II)